MRTITITVYENEHGQQTSYQLAEEGYLWDTASSEQGVVQSLKNILTSPAPKPPEPGVPFEPNVAVPAGTEPAPPAGAEPTTSEESEPEAAAPAHARGKHHAARHSR